MKTPLAWIVAWTKVVTSKNYLSRNGQEPDWARDYITMWLKDSTYGFSQKIFKNNILLY
jgi:hypothetical protein